MRVVLICFRKTLPLAPAECSKMLLVMQLACQTNRIVAEKFLCQIMLEVFCGFTLYNRSLRWQWYRPTDIPAVLRNNKHKLAVAKTDTKRSQTII